MIWDFDGTLVDSRHKNRAVTRTILARVTGRDADDFVALRVQADYDAAVLRMSNWRELYRHEYGLSAEETEHAGSLWEDAQRVDPTPAPFFEGVLEAIAELGDLPQGIVSQNSSLLIDRTLTAAGLSDFFGLIVGYESVEIERQKPHPAGLLRCLEHLLPRHREGRAGTVLYVGDHEVDARCAQRANEELAAADHPLRFVSVGAFYSYSRDDSGWRDKADRAVRHPHDISKLARELG